MFVPARVRRERLEVMDDDMAAVPKDGIGLGRDPQPIRRIKDRSDKDKNRR